MKTKRKPRSVERVVLRWFSFYLYMGTGGVLRWIIKVVPILSIDEDRWNIKVVSILSIYENGWSIKVDYQGGVSRWFPFYL